jgi:hypothetical protein
MPRDGSNIYHIPPGTTAIPNTTVASTPYNAYTADVEQDLNTPRPIVAGGTGATSADGALVNVSGEKAAQVVTSWDSMLWMPGSFYAAAGATGISPIGTVPPTTGHAFSGICYLNEPLANPPTNKNLVLEARDLTATGNDIYYRIMTAGVWGAWSVDVPDNVVRIDAAQSLTAAQQTQARQNIFAAPFDAMAYSGMQINGSMEISQERGYSNNRTTTGYVADGWALFLAGTMGVVSAVVSTNDISAIPYIIYVTTQTAQPSLGANDQTVLLQNIEGWRAERLAWGTPSAQPITIGFWSGHARPGIYSVTVKNGAFNRSYSTTYTHNTSGIYQYNAVTIPGDTTGTWAKDNTIGLQVIFAVAVGSAITAPSANTWSSVASGYSAAPGQVNGVGSVTDSFRITGVVILPGIEAPSAARSAFVMRPYDQELLMCRRYFYNGVPPMVCSSNGTSLSRMKCRHPVTMRAAPTLAMTAALSVYSSVAASTIASLGGNNSTVDVLETDATAAASMGTAGVITGVMQGSGNLNVDARL